MSRSQARIIMLCFFLSGVAGLMYEVAWTKALGLIFGHTVYAIATVLAAFMMGLAAGSAYLGKWGGAHARPIWLYGQIEFLVGVTGALSLLGLGEVRLLYVAAYHFASGSIPLLETLRFSSSVLVLFIPTFLMGGTLPILVAGIATTRPEVSTRVGQLYWINTAGAVAGALAAGFLCLPFLGLRVTISLAAICNIVAACIALTIGRRVAGQGLEETQATAGAASQEKTAFLLAGFALVGATSMAYEISWTRLLATTLGSSTYAFTTMLATFLAGIALGSWVFEKWVARGKTVSVGTFATTQVFTGLAATAFLVLFARMPAVAWWIVTATHNDFRGLVLAQFAICGLAMLPTAAVYGFNFPAVTSLIASRSADGSSSSAGVGRAMAANTVGAIVGSVATGFWLVPVLGSFRCVTLAATANILIAVLFLVRGRPRKTVELAGVFALGLIVIATGWSGLFYDKALANFSVASHPGGNGSNLSADQIAHMVDLIYTEDGLNATIAVARSENQLALRTNGKTDASTGDLISQLMLGHLGMVFHKAPRKVLVIGFGSGMTVSAVARYPEVARIDCVEIEPAVLRAAPFLPSLNRGVLNDPRLRIITDDARNFLFTARDQYDVIISEPSNPWIAGVASLFTDEFYAQVRSRLAPGGLLVQWVQAYALFPRDARMILHTLAPHFSRSSVWRGNLGDFLVLAQVNDGQLDFDHFHQVWNIPALRSDFALLGLNIPEGLIAYHLLDDSALHKLVAGATRNTDDMTRLEYRAPLALFAKDTTAENMRMFSQQGSAVFPATLAVRQDEQTLMDAARTSLFLSDPERAGRYLGFLPKTPTAETDLLRADWLLAGKRYVEAGTAFANAERLDPSSVAARMGLATSALRDKDYDTTERILREILERQPSYLPAFQIYAISETGRGNWKEALTWEMKRVQSDPSPPFADVLFLADLLVRNGDSQNAERVYVELLQRDPYNGPARSGLAELYRSEQRWEDARIQFEVIVRYFPQAGPKEYISLAEVYRKMGRAGDAEYCLLRGEKMFPAEASLFHVNPRE